MFASESKIAVGSEKNGSASGHRDHFGNRQTAGHFFRPGGPLRRVLHHGLSSRSRINSHHGFDHHRSRHRSRQRQQTFRERQQGPRHHRQPGCQRLYFSFQ